METTHPDRHASRGLELADPGPPAATEIASAPQTGRFDPHTGKLLESAARFDPETGKRLPIGDTRFIPRERPIGFLLAQAIWAIIIATLTISVHAQGMPTGPAIVGGLIWLFTGASVITIISFVYRKLRRLP